MLSEKNILSKDEFCRIINKLHQMQNFWDAVNDAGRKFDEGFYVEWYPPQIEVELCDTLSRMFMDDSDAVYWFCYEIGFGERYEDGDNMMDGKEYPLRDPEELYDYLVEVLAAGGTYDAVDDVDEGGDDPGQVRVEDPKL